MLAVLGTTGKRLFSSVTRRELIDALEATRKERAQQHQESQAQLKEIVDRVGKVEQDVAGLRGEMRGRFNLAGNNFDDRS